MTARLDSARKQRNDNCTNQPMTKKIAHSLDSETIPKEFLVPISTSSGYCLIGIKSGRIHDKGVVVYTGKDLSTGEVARKARESGILLDERLVDDYLKQVAGFRISNRIIVTASREFQIVLAHQDE